MRVELAPSSATSARAQIARTLRGTMLLAAWAAAAACATAPVSSDPRQRSARGDEDERARHALRHTEDAESETSGAIEGGDDSQAPPADDSEAPPATWREAVERHGHKCPGPLFELATPDTLQVGGRAWERRGSTLKLQGGRWSGPLKIGVIAALKDADPDTRENVATAARAFQKAGVHAVLVNGDVVGEEVGSLPAVVALLGSTFDVPVLAHAGNYEWTSAFTEAFEKGSERWPQLINMNIVRQVDLGGVHLVSLPGYFDRNFKKPGSCFYGDADVATVQRVLADISARGEVGVLLSHGPPRGRGDKAIDFAFEAGNVGDERLTELIAAARVPFGIFSHILEAGGRAQTRFDTEEAVPMPMNGAARTLYVNAGSASSYAWAMHDGRTSRGMAAIVTIDHLETTPDARVQFITLR